MCLMGGKTKQCLLKGCSGSCPESKRGHQVFSYITTLLITTSILTTHPFFIFFTRSSSHSAICYRRSCCNGYKEELINHRQATVGHLGKQRAKHTAFLLTDSHLLLHTMPLDNHTSGNAVFTGTCSTVAASGFVENIYEQTPWLLISCCFSLYWPHQ